jgi:predicted MFS family arabinose efflux permease
MERTKRFFQRHRRGFAITAVVVGAGYLAYTYIREKIKEVNEATSTERSDREKFTLQLVHRKLIL